MVLAPINPRTQLPILERIGIYGPPKTGKTHQIFTIAKWHQQLGSDAMFYGLSTDTSWDVLSMNPEFAHLTNIRWKNCYSLEAMITHARDFNRVIRPHDFLCSDLQTDAWGFAQDEYAQKLAQRASKGKKANPNATADMGDMWVVGTGEDYPISGWEWGMPNARYKALTNNLLLRTPGHLICVYSQKELMKESRSGNSDESEESKAMFGHLGVKPEGQKGDPFRWHTIIHVDRGTEPKTQVMATAGERWGNRRWLGRRMGNGRTRGEDVKDFFLEYMVNIAGWSM